MFATASNPPIAPMPLPAPAWQIRLGAPVPASAMAWAAPAPAPAVRPLALRYFPRDGSVFVDDEYLIKGVAGAIFWKLARALVEQQRADFTTRELRLAATELRLPDLKDNLDVRLLLLQRRLAERGGPLRIERTGRGRYRFVAPVPLRLEPVVPA